jgi:hypothetical protein
VEGKRWSSIFLGAAIPLFGLGITLCYLSLDRSMHYLLGLTPGGGRNLIQVEERALSIHTGRPDEMHWGLCCLE